MKNRAGRRRFDTTQWSLVAAAGADRLDPSRRRALEELCRAYWYPLYAFVRSRGYQPAEAQDLTQAFFARILETDGLAGANRRRGRFRSYLLGAMKHFLANEWHRKQAQKRGGGVQFVAWEALNPEARYGERAASTDRPEELFDREWALEVVEAALDALREEMVRAGKGDRFEILKHTLTGEEALSGQELAACLGLTEGAAKVAVHRLRRRFRQMIRQVILDTVANEEDLEDEMRYLVAVLRRG